MRSRLAVLMVMLALFSLSACGCGRGPSGSLPNDDTSVSVAKKGGGCTVILTAQPRLAEVGGTINITLTVTNDGKTSRTLELPSAQAFDFAAYSGETEVWRSSSGMSYAQVIMPFTFQPNENRIYSAAWDTEGEKPGKYRIEGVFFGLPGVKPAVYVTLSEGGSE